MDSPDGEKNVIFDYDGSYDILPRHPSRWLQPHFQDKKHALEYVILRLETDIKSRQKHLAKAKKELEKLS